MDDLHGRKRRIRGDRSRLPGGGLGLVRLAPFAGASRRIETLLSSEELPPRLGEGRFPALRTLVIDTPLVQAPTVPLASMLDALAAMGLLSTIRELSLPLEIFDGELRRTLETFARLPRSIERLAVGDVHDLEALVIFVRVAEMASFTRAADRLGIQKARASTAIRQLEKEVGARLLHRTTRSVQLTEDGRAFQARAQALLGESEELSSMFANRGARLRGRLRVDLPTELARTSIVPALPGFMAWLEKTLAPYLDAV